MIFIGFGYKIVTVNQKYPQAKIKNVALKEYSEVEQDLFVRVEQTKWMTNKEYVKVYGKNLDVDSEGNEKIILVDVTIKNDSLKEKVVNLYDFYIEKKGYTNGLALEAFMEVSKNQQSSVLLKSSEKYETTLVYIVNDFHFKKKDWDNIEQQRFYLVNSRYPVKTCWAIN